MRIGKAVQATFHLRRVPKGWERDSGKRDGSSLCTTAESWTSIMMVVLSVAFSVFGVMDERSGSLRLTVRLASSSACSLVSRLLQSCSVRLPVFPWGGSGPACGRLPSSAVPTSSASLAGCSMTFFAVALYSCLSHLHPLPLLKRLSYHLENKRLGFRCVLSTHED